MTTRSSEEPADRDQSREAKKLPLVGREALRECPFCGGSAEIVQIGNEVTAKRGFEVRCLTWGCATKKRALVIRQPLEKAREYAVKAWNARHEPALLPAPDAGWREILGMISRMAIYPDDKINRTTLQAAIHLARKAVPPPLDEVES